MAVSRCSRIFFLLGCSAGGLISSCGAFTIVSCSSKLLSSTSRPRRNFLSAVQTDESTEQASDFGTAAEVSNPYEEIGIEEDQLALGVNPVEVLNYVGT